MKYVYPYNSCYINLFIFFAIENNSDSLLLRQNYKKSITFTHMYVNMKFFSRKIYFIYNE